jgi:hypothetical protein
MSKKEEVKVEVSPLDLFLELMKEQYAKGYFTVNPVMSGLNSAIKAKFPDINPTEFTEALIEAGYVKIAKRWTYLGGKGTPNFYLTDEGQKEFGLTAPAKKETAIKEGAKVDKRIEALWKKAILSKKGEVKKS